MSELGAPRPLLGPARTTGLLAIATVVVVATLLGRAIPIIGAPVFGLALGIALAAIVPLPASARPTFAIVGRYGLQIAIVCLGASLDLSTVLRIGRVSAPVMLATLFAALIAAFVFARLLSVGSPMQILVGVGTGICGASAIAAISGIVGAAEAEIAYAVTTIFVFNLVALIVFPIVGHSLGLTQNAFGLWAGTAINDTSSVVAAAYSYGGLAGSHAVVVKLVRTLMIVPVSVALALRRRRSKNAVSLRLVKLIPWFLVLFVVASVVDTAGLISPIPGATEHLPAIVRAMTTIALCAIGLSTRLQAIRSTGPRPLLLGAIVWVTVASTSLGVQRATGQW